MKFHLSALLFFGIASTCFTANAQTKKAAAPQPASSSPAKAPVKDPQSKKVIYSKETSINFEDQQIEGSVKNPFASMLNSRESRTTRGFVKLRYNWHDQLIMSTSGLSQ